MSTDHPSDPTPAAPDMGTQDVTVTPFAGCQTINITVQVPTGERAGQLPKVTVRFTEIQFPGTIKPN